MEKRNFTLTVASSTPLDSSTTHGVGENLKYVFEAILEPGFGANGRKGIPDVSQMVDSNGIILPEYGYLNEDDGLGDPDGVAIDLQLGYEDSNIATRGYFDYNEIPNSVTILANPFGNASTKLEYGTTYHDQISQALPVLWLEPISVSRNANTVSLNPS